MDDKRKPSRQNSVRVSDGMLTGRASKASNSAFFLYSKNLPVEYIENPNVTKTAKTSQKEALSKSPELGLSSKTM